jgi:hypothetical protein
MDFINLEELEDKARDVLPKMVIDYYRSGAETEQSVYDNRDSFNRYRILPRILLDVSKLDTSCTILGMDLQTLTLRAKQWVLPLASMAQSPMPLHYMTVVL